MEVLYEQAGINGEEDDEILSCSDLKHCRVTHFDHDVNLVNQLMIFNYY
jgi:hypothetical protein